MIAESRTWLCSINKEYEPDNASKDRRMDQSKPSILDEFYGRRTL